MIFLYLNRMKITGINVVPVNLLHRVISLRFMSPYTEDQDFCYVDGF